VHARHHDIELREQIRLLVEGAVLELENLDAAEGEKGQ
jgi:hypothetical protein